MHELMVDKTFKCIICGEKTISPRSHIPNHNVGDLIDTLVQLTIKDEINDNGSEKIKSLSEFGLKT